METEKETTEYKDVESQIIDSPEGEFRIPEGADIDVSVSETPDKKLHITETVTVDEHEYLECEKRWVFLLLMMVGGFFGGKGKYRKIRHRAMRKPIARAAIEKSRHRNRVQKKARQAGISDRPRGSAQHR